MTPPIVVDVDPLRHDPEAAVLAALLAREIEALAGATTTVEAGHA